MTQVLERSPTNGDMAYIYTPFLKKERRDGALFVYGKTTGPQLDLDEQIVDADWARGALQDWMRVANIRQMHSPNLLPAGKALELTEKDDGFWLKAKVVEPGAIRLVESGVYTGFSIGIKSPKVVMDSQARGGRIVGGKIVETSLVDYPCLESAKIIDVSHVNKFVVASLRKGQEVEDEEDQYDHDASDGDVDHEHTHQHSDGTVHSHDHHHDDGESDHDSDDHLDLDDDDDEGDESGDEVEDVDKCAMPGCDCSCAPGAPDPNCDCECPECSKIRDEAKTNEEHEEAEDTSKHASTANRSKKSTSRKPAAAKTPPRVTAKSTQKKPVAATVGKREFSEEERKKLAREGLALPDGSFPIVTKTDLENAVKRFGEATPSDRAKAKRHIIRRARALGATSMLPEDWKVEKIFKAVFAVKSSFEVVLGKSGLTDDQRNTAKKAFDDFLTVMSSVDPIFDGVRMDILPPDGGLPNGGSFDEEEDHGDEATDKDLEETMKSVLAPIVRRLGKIEDRLSRSGQDSSNEPIRGTAPVARKSAVNDALVSSERKERDMLKKRYEKLSEDSPEPNVRIWASEQLASLTRD